MFSQGDLVKCYRGSSDLSVDEVYVVEYVCGGRNIFLELEGVRGMHLSKNFYKV